MRRTWWESLVTADETLTPLAFPQWPLQAPCLFWKDRKVGLKLWAVLLENMFCVLRETIVKMDTCEDT